MNNQAGLNTAIQHEMVQINNRTSQLSENDFKKKGGGTEQRGGR